MPKLIGGFLLLGLLVFGWMKIPVALATSTTDCLAGYAGGDGHDLNADLQTNLIDCLYQLFPAPTATPTGGPTATPTPTPTPGGGGSSSEPYFVPLNVDQLAGTGNFESEEPNAAAGELLLRLKVISDDEHEIQDLMDDYPEIATTERWGMLTMADLYFVQVTLVDQSYEGTVAAYTNLGQASFESDSNIMPGTVNISWYVDESSSEILEPNDPDYLSDDQWGLKVSDFPSAWNDVTHVSNFQIGVVDTGVMQAHPDLAGNLIGGARFLSDAGPSIEDTPEYWSACTTRGHGTKVNGVLAAVTNNSLFMAGGVWNTQVVNFNIERGDCTQEVPDVGLALDWLSQNANVKVVNLSLGENCSAFINVADCVQGFSNLKTSICNLTYGNADCTGPMTRLLVAAAGNDNADVDVYGQIVCSFTLPEFGGIESMICVTGTDGPFFNFDEQIDTFLNYGRRSIQMAAAGTGIVATNISGGVELVEGTSYAAPFVTAAASLVYQAGALRTPALTLEQVRDILLVTVDDKGDVETFGYDYWNTAENLYQTENALEDKVATGGRLNVGKAVGCAISETPEPNCLDPLSEDLWDIDATSVSQVHRGSESL